MSLSGSHDVGKRKKLFTWFGAFGLVVLVTLGVFASNGWLPRTDPLSGEKYGWFGKKLPKQATSAWNPFPPLDPTPQLSKEYIYASGSRLLAVEDANANAAPPADIAVWTPSNGLWAVMGQTGSQATGLQFGMSGDIPVPGDYDGDGKTDFAVFRPSSSAIFYVWPSGGGSYYGYYWGVTGDKPAMGDFDGDGKHDIVIARPNTGSNSLDWWIRKSSDSTYYAVSWGVPTDDLAVADYDGDGIADRAVYRSSDQTFYIIRSSDGGFFGVDIGVTGTVVSSDYS
ncbi:MAG: VCBS repeat-containing protein [Acidobacteriota bacterium]|nr:MAG: VCBS repeat-containing protein [Acidobacteriota bacterium]